MGNINEADKVMQAILNTGNPSADSLYYKARILQEVGRSEDAKKCLDLALKISKSFVHHKDAKDMSEMLAKLGNRLVGREGAEHSGRGFE